MQLLLDIKNMNMTDKFTILEELWEDMSKNISEDRFTPRWHLDALEKREENIKNGTSRFNDLDEAKQRLSRKN